MIQFNRVIFILDAILNLISKKTSRLINSSSLDKVLFFFLVWLASDCSCVGLGLSNISFYLLTDFTTSSIPHSSRALVFLTLPLNVLSVIALNVFVSVVLIIYLVFFVSLLLTPRYRSSTRSIIFRH